MTRSPMVTHDSRNNEHCAVEKKKGLYNIQTFRKLVKNYFLSLLLLKTFFARECTEAEATFYTRVHIAKE